MKMKTRKKTLYAILIFVVINVIVNYVFFAVKGSYPIDMFKALVPPILTELISIFLLGYKEKKNDKTI